MVVLDVKIEGSENELNRTIIISDDREYFERFCSGPSPDGHLFFLVRRCNNRLYSKSSEQEIGKELSNLTVCPSLSQETKGRITRAMAESLICLSGGDKSHWLVYL